MKQPGQPREQALLPVQGKSEAVAPSEDLRDDGGQAPNRVVRVAGSMSALATRSRSELHLAASSGAPASPGPVVHAQARRGGDLVGAPANARAVVHHLFGTGARSKVGPPIQWRTLPAARVLGSVLRSAAVQDRGPPYGSADGPLVGIGTMSHPKARCSDRWRALPAARVLGNALSRRRNTPRGLLRRNARPFPEKTTELSGARFAARPGPVAEASDLASSRERASTPGRAR